MSASFSYVMKLKLVLGCPALFDMSFTSSFVSLYDRQGRANLGEEEEAVYHLYENIEPELTTTTSKAPRAIFNQILGSVGPS